MSGVDGSSPELSSSRSSQRCTSAERLVQGARLGAAAAAGGGVHAMVGVPSRSSRCTIRRPYPSTDTGRSEAFTGSALEKRRRRSAVLGSSDRGCADVGANTGELGGAWRGDAHRIAAEAWARVAERVYCVRPHTSAGAAARARRAARARERGASGELNGPPARGSRPWRLSALERGVGARGSTRRRAVGDDAGAALGSCGAARRCAGDEGGEVRDMLRA